MSTSEFNSVGTEFIPVDTSAPNAWSRLGDATIVPPSVIADTPDRVPGTQAPTGTRGVSMLIVSAPALALTAFAFAVAQLFGDLMSGPLATLIPNAADSPVNRVRLIAVIHLGMSGVGAALGAAALLRYRQVVQASAIQDGGQRGQSCPRWVGWLAGAAPSICALVALQSVLLLILSALAPPSAPG